MTAVPDLMVTLATGTQVPWSEFKTWSHHKQAMSLLKVSEETRARRSAALKGREVTPEHRAKISAKRQLQVITDETRAKISADNLAKGKRPPDGTGRQHSTQAREAIANSQQERWHSTDPKWVAWRAAQQARREAKMLANGPRSGINATRVLKVYHTPFGEFAQREHAVEYLRLAGVPNWRRWLADQQQQYPNKYYFSRERVPK